MIKFPSLQFAATGLLTMSVAVFGALAPAQASPLAANPWASVGTAPSSVVQDAAGNTYTVNHGTGDGGGTVSKTLPNGSAAPAPWPVAVGIDQAVSEPFGIAIGPSGALYVTIGHYASADTVGRIVKILPDGSLAAGSWPAGPIAAPAAIVVDPAENVYVADLGGSSGYVHKFDSQGATASGFPLTVDGGASGIALDALGNFYVASDTSLAKFSTAGTLAGGAWPTALPSGPHSVGVSATGAIYTTNYGAASVSKFNANASAGTGSWPAPVATQPFGLAFDPLGSIYVASRSPGAVTKLSSEGGAAGGGWPVSVPSATALLISSAGVIFASNYAENTLTRIIDVPAAPPIPVVSLSGQALRVRVAASTDPGSSAISSYTAVAFAGSAPARSCSLAAAGTCNITGLAAGKYTVRVLAVNGSGTSPASNASPAVKVPRPIATISKASKVKNHRVTLTGTTRKKKVKVYLFKASKRTHFTTAMIGITTAKNHKWKKNVPVAPKGTYFYVVVNGAESNMVHAK